MKSSNNVSKKLFGVLFAALFGLLSISAAHAQIITLSNTSNGGNANTFGLPDTQTYGEVFTAPISGTLTSFTLSLNGGVGSLYGGVGTWNGPATIGLGYGSPVNLYQSADVSSLVAQPYTFSPDVNVIAGQQYVAYLSVYGDGNATNPSSVGMPLGSSASGLVSYVFNNTTDERNNAAWNYFGYDEGSNALFSASFSPAAAPEPSTWAMLLGGLGLLAFWRTRKCGGFYKTSKNKWAPSLALAALSLAVSASIAQATPLTLDYSVTPDGSLFNYSFTLKLDNNDSSWASGQNFNWIVFGDVPSATSPLSDFTLTSAAPAPFTYLDSTSGGHNGPTFIISTPSEPAGTSGWFPTAIGNTLSWTGTSASDLGQGDLQWSNLIASGDGDLANFVTATEVAAIPEPSTWALLLGGLGMLAFWRTGMRRAQI
jgi:MYXO-CTERM domain-containing protein